MGRFCGLTLTKNGRNLMAKALTGKELRFIRVATGDGYLAEDQTRYEMTALVHPRQDVPINACTVTNQVGAAIVKVIMTSVGNPEGYHIREVGLYALDPDDGTEVLYGYTNAGDESDYMVGDGGADVEQYVLVLTAVVDQAQHVTAIIDGGLVYATREELEQAIADLFKKAAPILEFWTRSSGDGNVLRPSSLDDVKLAILGITDIDSLNKRVERLEDVVAQILLELEVKDIYPDYTHWTCEDFRNPDQVDLYACKVLSVVAGDDSLDCDPVAGMYPGSWYTITDGLNYELVRVKSVSIENAIQRVILADPVQNTYRLENCRLYRTSATIGENCTVSGPTGKKTESWNPTTVWKGQMADEEVPVKLETTVGNSGLFITEGDVGFTADGLLTLEVASNEI